MNYVKIMIHILLSLMMLTNSGKPAYELKIEYALRHDGSYTFPSLEWRVSPDYVEKATKFVLGEPYINSEVVNNRGENHNNTLYYPQTPAMYNGNEGVISFQFIDDRLVDVTISYKKNLNDLAEIIIGQAHEFFGEPQIDHEDEKHEILGDDISISTKTWEHVSESTGDKTMFSISLIKNKNKIVTLSLSFSCPDVIYSD